MKKYFLRTERLGFSQWSEDDIEIAGGLWGDPEVTKYIDARGQLSEFQIREKLAREAKCLEEYGVQYWPVFSLETGENIGCCGLRPYDLKGNIYEIGFHIRSKHWGKGYGCEAARAVIDYAFGNLNISALFAGHNPENKPSKSLLLKLGFRYTHKEFYPQTGLMHPSYLLRQEDYKK